ncbi:MAG: hypothetical protein KAS96_02410 [Planctomycetes bacterium]|nr:hypothetical protein [Planctomycetota bacterium]
MARVLLVIMMICTCFCVTGCKKKESTTDTAIEKKAVEAKPEVRRATDEIEGTIGVMDDMQ